MEWISVEDQLPSDCEDVLVYFSADDHISVGSYEKDNIHFYIEANGSKFYVDTGWETEIPWAPKGGITHWMSLPEPPNEMD